MAWWSDLEVEIWRWLEESQSTWTKLDYRHQIQTDHAFIYPIICHDLCLKCCQDKGTLFHFGAVQKLKHCRKNSYNLCLILFLMAWVFILRLLPPEPRLSGAHKNILLCSSQAKRCIWSALKRTETLTVEHWFKDFLTVQLWKTNWSHQEENTELLITT